MSAAEIGSIRDSRPDLVARATELQRPAAIRLLVGLGWDVNHLHRSTALHEAALRGNLALAQLLIELGTADSTIEDTDHRSTPQGWADHGGHSDVVAYLASLHNGTNPPEN